MLNTILLQAGGDAGLMNILMIVAIFVIFYFFMIRPQQKKQKEIKKFRDAIKAGDEIITAGGIYGKVRKVSETTFTIEIANGVQIKIDKNSVYPSAAEADASKEN